MLDGRGADAQVNFGSAGAPQQRHHMGRGSAAHDAVVHHHQALAPQDGGHRIELLAHAPVAALLFRLNKSAPHIAVPHQAVGEGDARFLGKAHSGGGGRIGDADNQVGIGGVLAGQAGAHLLAGAVHQAAVHHAVGAGEVDPFKDAEGAAARRRRVIGVAIRAVVHCRMDAVGADGNHLAGFQFADEIGLQVVQGAGFGGGNPAAVVGQAAQAEGANAQGIAGRNQQFGRQQRQGKGAFHPLHSVAKAFRPGGAGGVGEEMGDDFGVGAGGEVAAAFRLQALAQQGGVDDVAVVGHRQVAVFAINQQGLRVAGMAGAGGGVAGMADGEVSRQPVQVAVGKGFGNEAHTGVDPQAAGGVGSSHAGRFLAPVLEGKEAHRRQGSAVGAGRKDADDAAGFPGAVVPRLVATVKGWPGKGRPGTAAGGGGMGRGRRHSGIVFGGTAAVNGIGGVNGLNDGQR